jgi:hypothetical protein
MKKRGIIAVLSLVLFWCIIWLVPFSFPHIDINITYAERFNASSWTRLFWDMGNGYQDSGADDLKKLVYNNCVLSVPREASQSAEAFTWIPVDTIQTVTVCDVKINNYTVPVEEFYRWISGSDGAEVTLTDDDQIVITPDREQAEIYFNDGFCEYLRTHHGLQTRFKWFLSLIGSCVILQVFIYRTLKKQGEKK